MARIKIKDLPKDLKISPKEMKKITGGFTLGLISTPWLLAPTVATAIAVPVALHGGDDDVP
ncbi:MAG: hypothetical protein JRF41_14640 [Deltaproteobacteria bacterium]|nr:hypothetical protein [Deltaproteobacteria bacterium]MBW2324720.1 hypothetical protein [Deltaproteobacteria bacterium]